ncbi:DHBP synthase RibB-like alpha/beta domain-containing protein [Polychytrium aggregatum]|uniref:DHBP synthase RibB-like alpha/beta domain-containing protein n=1 Tax=Polychytrium aggregatum TaxID=110093 RepID=UPI0022FE1919|nr:DHBP synthase RibB-like alpha/beta domain-containing protein [Polychytrium aggregatum]KAI9202348.1 DHBP synthase RibB-like alpha/beta domain-containing protein [Polychytrium aggregatum]
MSAPAACSPSRFATEILSADPESFSFAPRDPAESPLLRPVLQVKDSPKAQQDHASLLRAVELLRSNEPVAIPTETVYGLAANALSPEAVAKIFLAKGRPSDNPLIIHVSSIEMLLSILPSELSHRIPQVYQALIDRHWPGPLTILVPRSSKIPKQVTGGHDTVAVRFPSHPIARALISLCGFPLAAPSANTSGRPSPTLAGHVFADLQGRIPLIIDGGSCDSGVESTVLDGFATPPAILRPGGITYEQIKAFEGMENVRVYRRDYVDEALEAAPTTPGMKYRHYSPNVEVVLFEVSSTEGHLPNEAVLSKRRAMVQTEITKRLESSPGPIGVLRTWFAAGDTEGGFRYDGNVAELALGAESDPHKVAQELFKGLRELEERKVAYIFVEGIGEKGEGLAVMNRLRKAASTVVSV